MGELKDVNRDDLLNRYADHSFTEITVDDQTRVDFEHDDTIDSVGDSPTLPGTARFAFASGPTLVVGQRVINSGFTTNTDYNGTHIVSATDGTTYFEVTGISFGTTEAGNLAALVGSAQDKVVDVAYQRIRQELVGGGNILLGDFTFQGSTKFGGSTAILPDGAIDVVGTDAPTGRIRTIRYQANANGAGALQLGHSRGSEGSLSALLSGDKIGQILYVGDDGVQVDSSGPFIRAFTTENWSASAKGNQIRFETIPNGSTTAALAFVVSEHGYPEAPAYTVATLPNVGGGGGIIFVSDETGGATLALSDGTNWRRVQDRAVVA